MINSERVLNCMDNLDYDYLKDYDIDSEVIRGLLERAANGDTPLSPPLKPNQTTGSEKISLRIPHHVLSKIKAQAFQSGEPYQTYINQILDMHASKYLQPNCVQKL